MAFFAQAGQDPMEIYRIEQFEPIKQDPEFHGKFYTGDSYVVLKKQRNCYEIHYWHGNEATSVSAIHLHYPYVNNSVVSP